MAVSTKGKEEEKEEEQAEEERRRRRKNGNEIWKSRKRKTEREVTSTEYHAEEIEGNKEG